MLDLPAFLLKFSNNYNGNQILSVPCPRAAREKYFFFVESVVRKSN